MDAKKVWDIFSISAAVVSLALGIWGRDGAVMALSCFAISFSVVSLLRCTGKVHLYSAVMSAAVLVCAVLSVTIFSYETLVEGGVVSPYGWVGITAVVRGAAILPLIIMFFFATAAIFKASYNWALVFGFGWLVGTGFHLPMCMFIYVVQFSDLELGIVTNNGLVVGMIIGMVISIAFTFVLRSVFKKNLYLITENGLVVRQ